MSCGPGASEGWHFERTLIVGDRYGLIRKQGHIAKGKGAMSLCILNRSEIILFWATAGSVIREKSVRRRTVMSAKVGKYRL